MIPPIGDGTSLPGVGTTNLGDRTAISGGGTPDTGGGTPFRLNLSTGRQSVTDMHKKNSATWNSLSVDLPM